MLFTLTNYFFEQRLPGNGAKQSWNRWSITNPINFHHNFVNNLSVTILTIFCSEGSILMMNLLQNLAHAFSLLVQDEKQREIRTVSHLSVDSTSLNMSASGQGAFKTNFPTNNNYSGIPRTRLIYEHCKNSEHSKERCYKLHGYPQNNHNSTQNFTPRHFSSS